MVLGAPGRSLWIGLSAIGGAPRDQCALDRSCGISSCLAPTPELEANAAGRLPPVASGSDTPLLTSDEVRRLRRPSARGRRLVFGTSFDVLKLDPQWDQELDIGVAECVFGIVGVGNHGAYVGDADAVVLSLVHPDTFE